MSKDKHTSGSEMQRLARLSDPFLSDLKTSAFGMGVSELQRSARLADPLNDIKASLQGIGPMTVRSLHDMARDVESSRDWVKNIGTPLDDLLKQFSGMTATSARDLAKAQEKLFSSTPHSLSALVQSHLAEMINWRDASAAEAAGQLRGAFDTATATRDVLRLLDDESLSASVWRQMLATSRIHANLADMGGAGTVVGGAAHTRETADRGQAFGDAGVDLNEIKDRVAALVQVVGKLAQSGDAASRTAWTIFLAQLIITIFQAFAAPALDYYIKEVVLKPTAAAEEASDRERLKRIEKQVEQLAAPPLYRATRRITDRDLNARFNPKAASPQVGRLPMSTLVVVLKDEGDWTQIEFTSGDVTKVGWVFSRYLKKL